MMWDCCVQLALLLYNIPCCTSIDIQMLHWRVVVIYRLLSHGHGQTKETIYSLTMDVKSRRERREKCAAHERGKNIILMDIKKTIT